MSGSIKNPHCALPPQPKRAVPSLPRVEVSSSHTRQAEGHNNPDWLFGRLEHEAPGHWRCVFFIEKTPLIEAVIGPGARWLSDEEIVAPQRYATEVEADIAGRAEDAKQPQWVLQYAYYLRAEFYPEYVR